jgi:hypothetical protein
VPQWIVEERSARRVHSPGDVQGARHAESRDAGGFGATGDQSNGLMAHWSDGHE